MANTSTDLMQDPLNAFLDRLPSSSPHASPPIALLLSSPTPARRVSSDERLVHKPTGPHRMTRIGSYIYLAFRPIFKVSATRTTFINPTKINLPP